MIQSNLKNFLKQPWNQLLAPHISIRTSYCWSVLEFICWNSTRLIALPLQISSPEPHILYVSWTLVTRSGVTPAHNFTQTTLSPWSHTFVLLLAWQVRVAKKTNGKVLRFIVNLWSANQPAISQKMPPISSKSNGHNGQCLQLISPLGFVEWTVSWGSVRGGEDLTRPVRINYQHQRQLLSFVSTCHPDHHCQQQEHHHFQYQANDNNKTNCCHLLLIWSDSDHCWKEQQFHHHLLIILMSGEKEPFP